MTAKQYDALHLITWAGSASADPGLIATAEELAVGVATLQERGETEVRTEELLHVDAETQIETKLFRNAAGHYCVRVYDLEVGETVGVNDYGHDLDAALYQFRLCSGVETMPSSFGVL
jgi:hypothetical protein